MISINKITLPNGRTQWCLMKGGRADLDLACNAHLSAKFFRPCSSETFVDSQANVFLKASSIKSFFLDNLAKLICWTTADRESRGNLVLQKLELITPRIIACAIPLNPFNPYRSLLYCQLLDNVISLDEYLRNNPDATDRQELMDTVAVQIANMFRAGVYFRDLYFGNILYSTAGELYWVDTDVQVYTLKKAKPRQKFMEKKQFMYERFLRGGGHSDEWERFLNIIMGGDPPSS